MGFERLQRLLGGTGGHQWGRGTRSLAIALAMGTLLLSVVFSPGPAQAQVNCSRPEQWSATTPQINQTHVFCGEWNSTGPGGFHSRPNGHNPPTVNAFRVASAPNHQGIYDGYWSYVGHRSPTKYSTMFPDDCAPSQVLQSILFAARSPMQCPADAPEWASCGLNAPSRTATGYCLAHDGTRFTIALARLRYDSNRVNTAFPLR